MKITNLRIGVCFTFAEARSLLGHDVPDNDYDINEYDEGILVKAARKHVENNSSLLDFTERFMFTDCDAIDRIEDVVFVVICYEG